MNVQDYIRSGILEEYCLGLLSANEQAVVLKICKLFPEVQKELTAIETVIEVMAADSAMAPKAELKQRILDSLGFPDEPIKLDLDNLPNTDRYSNHRSWLKSLEEFIPREPTEEFSCKVLRQDDKVTQMLIVTENDVAPEIHRDIKESFFILKGVCTCTVGANIFTLSPGDFLEIPLYVEHNIKLRSPYVVAILQHQYA